MQLDGVKHRWPFLFRRSCWLEDKANWRPARQPPS